MAKKLIGFREGTGKQSGKHYECITISSKCDVNDNERGVYGEQVETVFLPDKLHGYVLPKHIGHEVELSYNVSNGKAFLNDVKIL